MTSTGGVYEPRRQTIKRAVTTVRHVMEAFGRNRENPPSLGQLRQFVDACDGLDDETGVSINRSSLSESGRHTYTFSVRVEEPIE